MFPEVTNAANVQPAMMAMGKRDASQYVILRVKMVELAKSSKESMFAFV